MNDLRSRSVAMASDAETILEHIDQGSDIIVPLANGEPATLLDAIDRAAPTLSDVRVHQMHALRQFPRSFRTSRPVTS